MWELVKKKSLEVLKAEERCELREFLVCLREVPSGKIPETRSSEHKRQKYLWKEDTYVSKCTLVTYGQKFGNE